MAFPLIHPHLPARPTLESAVWFQQLRWVAVAGQLATLAFVALLLEITLPTRWLLLLIGATATTNCAYALWLRRLRVAGLDRDDRLPSEQVVPVLMLIDILVLTGMLFLSGGMTNPFALFYFVNIAIAGALLPQVWAWGIWLATITGVMFLLQIHIPIDAISTGSNLANAPTTWTIPKVGYIVSFATCSAVITYFTTGLTGELRRREKELQDAEDEKLRSRQLEGLATLAAGAAHELASPLSTIAVIATELSRSLARHEVAEGITRDVELIRSELDRCRQILDRMTSAAGDAAGERLESISIEKLLQECILGLREPGRVSLSIADGAAESQAILPIQATAQAIRNLLQNALDASRDDATVSVEADEEDGMWVLSVIDRGTGMPQEVLSRIGEPFFTTKEPGRGMGLGLYLTQNVLRRLGGSVEFESRPGEGTVATIELPRSQ